MNVAAIARSVAAIARRACNRIAQGCRLSGYPGGKGRKNNTPTGFRRGDAVLRNPFRVEIVGCGRYPKVAAARQPWAIIHNPFGIKIASPVYCVGRLALPRKANLTGRRTSRSGPPRHCLCQAMAHHSERLPPNTGTRALALRPVPGLPDVSSTLKVRLFLLELNSPVLGFGASCKRR